MTVETGLQEFFVMLNAMINVQLVAEQMQSSASSALMEGTLTLIVIGYARLHVQTGLVMKQTSVYLVVSVVTGAVHVRKSVQNIAGIHHVQERMVYVLMVLTVDVELIAITITQTV